MSENFWRVYAIVGCIWMAVHFTIYLLAMMVLKRKELGELEDLYTRPIYHIFGVFLDGFFWPISIPIKLPGMTKAIFGVLKNGLIYIKLSIEELKDNQNGSKKGEKR